MGLSLEEENNQLKNKLSIAKEENLLNSVIEDVNNQNRSIEDVYSSQLPITSRSLLTYNYHKLLDVYLKIAEIRKIIDSPVDEAMLGGVKIYGDGIDKEVNTMFNGYIRRENYDFQEYGGESPFKAISTAVKLTRLFGGGGIILFDNNPEDTEINLANPLMSGNIIYRAFNRWEIERQDDSYYYYSSSSQTYSYHTVNKNQIPIHKSRVIKIRTGQAPYYIDGMLNGWGLSVLEDSISAINNIINGRRVAYELLSEAKIDVYKFKDYYSKVLTDEGYSKMTSLLSKVQRSKNAFNGIVLDSEDDYQQKQSGQIAGLAVIFKDLQEQLAFVAGKSADALFGRSPTGYGANELQLLRDNLSLETNIRPLILQLADKIIPVAFKMAIGKNTIPDNFRFELCELPTMDTSTKLNNYQLRENLLRNAVEGGYLEEEIMDQFYKGMADDIL